MRLLCAKRALLALIVLSPSHGSCAIFAIAFIRTRPAPDQHQRRLPASQRPAGRAPSRPSPSRSMPTRRAERPSGRRRRPSRSMARAATRCCSAPPRRTASRRRCLAPATRSGWAPCSSAPAKSKGRASGSPASRMRCAPPMPTRSAAGRPRTTCSRPRPATRDGVSAGAASVEATPGASADVVLPGAENFLAKYLPGGADVGSSARLRDASRPSGHRHDDAARLPARALHQHHRRGSPGSRSRISAAAPRRIPACSSTTRTARSAQFQGFNNTHPRIPHQQHRAGVAAERRVQRVDQLHDRQHVALLRRQQRQHRHRHHHAVGAPRSQQCRARRAREHVDDQLHERDRSLLHGEESQRHGRRANGRAGR